MACGAYAQFNPHVRMKLIYIDIVRLDSKFQKRTMMFYKLFGFRFTTVKT